MGCEKDPISVLDHICKEYIEDVSSFYNTQSSLAAKKKTPERRPRYSFIQLARKLFDTYDKLLIPSLFTSLFDISGEYASSKGYGKIGCAEDPTTLRTIPDLLLNLIIAFQIPQPSKNDEGNIVKANNQQRRVRFSIEQAKIILSRVLPITLPPESKLWKHIRYILVPDNDSNKMSKLAPIIAESAENGSISFEALVFCMQSEGLNNLLTPICILQALFLGPLKSTTVEFFASGRSLEFRRQCRDFIQQAEYAKEDPITFRNKCPVNIKNHPELTNYRDFLYNATQLIYELRGLKYHFGVIPAGWACKAIKKFGKRTYSEKTWRSENLFDLIWTILVQRPTLKKFVCETLEKEFHDYGAARFWKKIIPAQLDRVYILNQLQTQIDPMYLSSDYLNFPPIVKGVMCVANTVELCCVMKRIHHEINCFGRAIVGLDAEWSAFTGYSKASILQVAIRDHVYIIDLDSNFLTRDDLKNFFNDLFLNPNILKFGFQFSEDLYQLRNAISHCKALYQPENVFCVGKMIRALLELTEKREDSVDVLNDVVPYFSLTPLDDSMDSLPDEAKSTLDDGDENESSKPQNEQFESASERICNKGLSYICQKVLGRPLDKTEQCSVWDRRPLRPYQVRYAAMDAYCCIMLYDVCDAWAKRLGTTIQFIVSDQKPIRISLPLFSDTD